MNLSRPRLRLRRPLPSLRLSSPLPPCTPHRRTSLVLRCLAREGVCVRVCVCVCVCVCECVCVCGVCDCERVASVNAESVWLRVHDFMCACLFCCPPVPYMNLYHVV